MEKAESRFAELAALGAPLRKRRKENAVFKANSAWLHRSGATGGEVMGEEAFFAVVETERARAIADVAQLEDAISEALRAPAAVGAEERERGMEQMGPLAKVLRRETALREEIAQIQQRRGAAASVVAAVELEACPDAPAAIDASRAAEAEATRETLVIERARLAAARDALELLRSAEVAKLSQRAEAGEAAVGAEAEVDAQVDASADAEDEGDEEAAAGDADDADKTVILTVAPPHAATPSSAHAAALEWLATQSARAAARITRARGESAAAAASLTALEKHLCVLARTVVSAAAGGRDVAAVSARILKALLAAEDGRVAYAAATARVPDKTLALAALRHLEALGLVEASEGDGGAPEHLCLAVQ
jgi:hypothetical protein